MLRPYDLKSLNALDICFTVLNVRNLEKHQWILEKSLVIDITRVRFNI